MSNDITIEGLRDCLALITASHDGEMYGDFTELRREICVDPQRSAVVLLGIAFLLKQIDEEVPGAYDVMSAGLEDLTSRGERADEHIAFVMNLLRDLVQAERGTDVVRDIAAYRPEAIELYLSLATNGLVDVLDNAEEQGFSTVRQRLTDIGSSIANAEFDELDHEHDRYA